MSKNNQKSPALASRRDILIIVIALAALGLWALWSYVISPAINPDTDLKYAWIYHDNDLVEKVALDGTARTWHLEVTDFPNIEMTIETTEDRKIRITESNCPDKICVNTGAVSMDGQSIACLPNHVIVKIGDANGPTGFGING